MVKKAHTPKSVYLARLAALRDAADASIDIAQQHGVRGLAPFDNLSRLYKDAENAANAFAEHGNPCELCGKTIPDISQEHLGQISEGGHYEIIVVGNCCYHRAPIDRGLAAAEQIAETLAAVKDPGEHYRGPEIFGHPLDPYRVIEACPNINREAARHVLKKIMRMHKKGAQSERQLIAELRCCIDRWEQMLDEEEKYEESESA